MSHFRRNRQHQQFARAVSIFPTPSDTSGAGEGPGGPDGPGPTPSGPSGGNNSSKSKPTPTPPSTSKPPAKPTPDQNSSKKPEDVDSETETTKESSKSSASASSTKSDADSTSTKPTPITNGGNTLPTANGNTFLPLVPTDTNTDLMPSIDPTSAAANNNSTSGAINTGAIIGGIAGGLGGIALLGVLISFILRRYRSKRRAEEFDASQFRRSAMIMDTDDPRPISLFGGRFGGVAPSVRSSVGPGMAGHGAYQAYSDNTPTQPNMQQYEDDYQTTPTTAAALQPRQQYTYGEEYDNTAAGDDDLTHGAYSEQPQPQAVYNLEAYGDYEAYSGSGVQYPAAAHQGRQAQRDDDPYGGI